MADGALLPAELAFRQIVAARNRLYDRRDARVSPPGIPVISVGNLTVGGSGKTPVTAWLAGLLTRRGHAPAVILRGYGADEIELHSELNPGIPVLAGRNRSALVEEAMHLGADCALLDDGFQHRALRRDLDLVLVSAEQWAGNRRMLPRGPFREPFDSLRRADMVIVTRKVASRAAAEAVLADLGSDLPESFGVVHLRTHSAMRRLTGAGKEELDLGTLAGREVLAVTAMAEPDLFTAQLRQLGADVRALSYPDHHSFTEREIGDIVRAARGATVVVSGKESVGLRGRFPEGVDVLVVGLAVEMEQGRDRLDHLLDELFRRS